MNGRPRDPHSNQRAVVIMQIRDLLDPYPRKPACGKHDLVENLKNSRDTADSLVFEFFVLRVQPGLQLYARGCQASAGL